tara:strand:- start:23 stop:478 length:456 start_codon:yes stop_codon:yes gene_type:complete
MNKVILVEPEIPQNTGTIARLCAATNSELILVGKLGFSLEDKYLKRAGLDYWKYVNWRHEENKELFFTQLNIVNEDPWLLSTKGKKIYTDVKFQKHSMLIFGSETKGLSQSIRDNYSDRLITIPMENINIRSLNLANSVSIVLYESIRQNS